MMATSIKQQPVVWTPELQQELQNAQARVVELTDQRNSSLNQLRTSLYDLKLKSSLPDRLLREMMEHAAVFRRALLPFDKTNGGNQ